MREISRFQMNVAAAWKNLQDAVVTLEPQQEEERLAEKLAASKQEPIRIAIAVYAYFRQPKISEKFQRELEKYIRIRVRNVMDTLIELDDPDKILILEEKGWFGKAELGGFIQTARERQKLQALICLMLLKNEKYGYQEADLEL